MPWHPGAGIRIPRLPKIYASMKSDGSLSNQDINKFKQFRANHSGPTDLSYWVVRGTISLSFVTAPWYKMAIFSFY